MRLASGMRCARADSAEPGEGLGQQVGAQLRGAAAAVGHLGQADRREVGTRAHPLDHRRADCPAMCGRWRLAGRRLADAAGGTLAARRSGRTGIRGSGGVPVGLPVFKTGGAAFGVARWVRLPCAPATRLRRVEAPGADRRSGPRASAARRPEASRVQLRRDRRAAGRGSGPRPGAPRPARSRSPMVRARRRRTGSACPAPSRPAAARRRSAAGRRRGHRGSARRRRPGRSATPGRGSPPSRRPGPARPGRNVDPTAAAAPGVGTRLNSTPAPSAGSGLRSGLARVALDRAASPRRPAVLAGPASSTASIPASSSTCAGRRRELHVDHHAPAGPDRRPAPGRIQQPGRPRPRGHQHGPGRHQLPVHPHSHHVVARHLQRGRPAHPDDRPPRLGQRGVRVGGGARRRPGSRCPPGTPTGPARRPARRGAAPPRRGPRCPATGTPPRSAAPGPARRPPRRVMYSSPAGRSPMANAFGRGRQLAVQRDRLAVQRGQHRVERVLDHARVGPGCARGQPVALDEEDAARRRPRGTPRRRSR